MQLQGVCVLRDRVFSVSHCHCCVWSRDQNTLFLLDGLVTCNYKECACYVIAASAGCTMSRDQNTETSLVRVTAHELIVMMHHACYNPPLSNHCTGSGTC